MYNLVVAPPVGALRISNVPRNTLLLLLLLYLSAMVLFVLYSQLLSVICIQAPDPQAMQNTFESFCHSVVNKGDQIVHKLLGDQFKVCWQLSKLIICLIIVSC